MSERDENASRRVKIPFIEEEVRGLSERMASLEATLRAMYTGGTDPAHFTDDADDLLLSQTRQALLEAQERYRRLVTRMSAVVFELSSDGTILFVNEAVTKITGYPSEELQGKNWWDVFFPDERQSLAVELQARLRTGDVSNEELILKSKSGSEMTLELNSANRYRSDGTLESVIGFGVDMTDRKWAERRLRRSERHFRSLIENALDIITILNVDGTIRYGSPSIETILGYKNDELIGKEVLEFIHPDDAQNVRSAITRVSQIPGYSMSLEFRARHQNGEWRIFEGIGKNLTDDPDIEGIIVNSRDITERKWAEERLKRNEKQFRSLIDNALDIITILNANGTIRYVSPSVERVLGYKPEDLIGKSISAFIHPDALPSVTQVFQRGWEVPGGIAALEFRFRHKDGSWRSIEAVGNNLLGDPVIAGVVINSRDITERKEAEERRRESDERFRQIAENIREVFWMTDLQEGQILYASPAYEQISGRSVESLYQNPRSWMEAIHPDDRSRALSAAIDRQIRGDYDEEYRIMRPDGAIRWIRNRAVPVRGSTGRVYRIAGIAEDITDRKRAEDQILHMAYYDALTGLPNRLFLHDRLQQMIVEAKTGGMSVALLLLNLDRFKEINDTLGYHHGDILLQQIGHRLRSALWARDVVGRLGGDEFIALLPLADSDHAKLVADKIIEALEPSYAVENLPVIVEGTIGIALYPEHGETADVLIQRADVALNMAKKHGIGYVIYDSSYDEHSPRRLALMAELRRAIEEGQLFLEYQPKVCLHTRRVFGVEALVRWRHPERGLIPPDHFIASAERMGLIKPLTLWVLDATQLQLIAWHRMGIQIGVSVNLSTRSLHDIGFIDQMIAQLSCSELWPGHVEMEITESAIMADPVRALEAIACFRQLGVRFAIDDFGIGYSSLAYLKKLPVDIIKIDKSFVMNMTTDANDAAIVHSTIELAHNLGRRVVAEGVENQETLDRLSALGCDAVQGYFLSRPVPPDKFVLWLEKSPWRPN